MRIENFKGEICLADNDDLEFDDLAKMLENDRLDDAQIDNSMVEYYGLYQYFPFSSIFFMESLIKQQTNKVG